jgi:hypothetical protein
MFFISIKNLYALDDPLPRFYIVENWFLTRDSLWNIAANPAVYNDPMKWHILYEYNKEKFLKQDNPDHIIPGMVIEIPSINNEYRVGIYSREILNYAIPDFTGLCWKSNGEIINEGNVDDIVTLSFNAINIPDNSKITIFIYEKNINGKDDFLEKIETLSENNITKDWIIKFDEKKLGQCSSEIQQNGYTIPEYYFIAQYGNYVSVKSNIISIKGWIRLKFFDEEFDITLRNYPIMLILGDGTEMETTTDDNGYVDVKGTPIGNVLYYLLDKE